MARSLTIYTEVGETGADQSAWGTIQKWLDRGDGVAVYENSDLGHWNMGHRQYVSYGSPVALLEVSVKEELPERLPDIGGCINWRYYLVGVMETEKERG